MAHDLQPGAFEERNAAEHLLAEDRMRPHEPLLRLGQRSRLLEDAVRDPDLPHVMEEEPVLRAQVGA
jgi:hypothetical protein